MAILTEPQDFDARFGSWQNPRNVVFTDTEIAFQVASLFCMCDACCDRMEYVAKTLDDGGVKHRRGPIGDYFAVLLPKPAEVESTPGAIAQYLGSILKLEVAPVGI
ncbi:MAG: hypothetical protein HZB70_03490 [Candidatus Berkelbacteria bacterium]|nr:MAG: hypothetical protein HZB70_03490 [Candidatus Berkelbacteria bacterium]QQG51635.1 MAG: hypothetical protein HY845_03700 [Candidatus Berkelbacteria bacterium]